MKGAIVGFGEVARHGHWPAYALSDRLEIVAIVDRTEARRATAARLSPVPRTYATIEALAAHETIDFIDICTPPAVHEAPMLAALERGWHVVCEKPFLLKTAALTRVRAIACARRLAAVPVHNWAFAPIVADATARLQRGDIGPLRHVTFETERVRDFQGADPASPNWRRDPALAGGGILLDHGWHAMYLLLRWFGAPPTDVGAAFHRPRAGGVEDEAAVRLTFAEGDALITLTWNGVVRRNTIRLEGDRGTMVIDDDRLIVSGGAGDEALGYPVALSAGSHHADWFGAFIPQLAEYFSRPQTSLAAFDEAAACLAIIERAYQVGAASRLPAV